MSEEEKQVSSDELLNQKLHGTVQNFLQQNFSTVNIPYISLCLNSSKFSDCAEDIRSILCLLQRDCV